jgi:hypothetical protein
MKAERKGVERREGKERGNWGMKKEVKKDMINKRMKKEGMNK